MSGVLNKNVLSGLMFMLLAGLGLWLARDYPLGSLRRMGTGFMPQLLCWLLMTLGVIVLVQGLFERARIDSASQPAPATITPTEVSNYWPILWVTASLLVFGLSLTVLGLASSIVLLVTISSFSYPGLKWWETVCSAIVLVGLCWVVFVLGLGMSVNLLPEFMQ